MSSRLESFSFLEKKNIIKVFKGKIIFTAIKDLEQPI